LFQLRQLLLKHVSAISTERGAHQMLIPKDSQEYLELTEMLVNRSQCQYNILLNISNICMFVKSLRHEVQTFASYVDGYVKVCTSRLISDQIGIRLTVPATM